jgi:tetratricopeptide (TPR) repeat protein
VYRLALLGAGVLAGGCAAYVPFDAEAHLDQKLHERVPAELVGRVEYPFELGEAARAAAHERINLSFSEGRRTEAILDFVFAVLDLQYALTPTRTADQTFVAREGNCLSFVNLFVGLGREFRLNPFYVEVEDYQRWNYQDGVVISRGHIVAGMYINGQLSTFDFLPYQAKGYRDFAPIDDLAAMAHHYNNLGAEALMADDIGVAEDNLRIAVALAPDFDKARNNLGVVLLRQGKAKEAIDLYEDTIEVDPENVPILTNLARAYQQSGRTADADRVFDKLESINQTNPFFFVYRGDLALGRGDTTTALDYMRRAYQADDNLPEVHVGLARVYMALGRLAEAQHHVERALRLDATHDEARKYAALLQQRLPTNGRR